METKDFRIMESVGRGAFATVYSAVYKDGKEVGVAFVGGALMVEGQGQILVVSFHIGHTV